MADINKYSLEEYVNYLFSTEDTSIVGNDYVYIYNMVAYSGFKIKNFVDAGRKFLWNVCKSVTKSCYVHTALSFDDKGKNLYEVNTKGFNAHPFDKSDNVGTTDYIDVYKINVSPRQKTIVKNLLEKKVGKKDYDYLQLVRLLLPFMAGKKNDRTIVYNEDKFTCSGFIAAVLYAAVPVFRKCVESLGKHVTYITPADYSKIDCCKFHKQINIVKSGNKNKIGSAFFFKKNIFY